MSKYLYSGVFVMFLIGCSTPMITTQKVYIPIKCDIQMPIKQAIEPSDNFYEKARRIMRAEIVYRMELEHSLKFCIGEE